MLERSVDQKVRVELATTCRDVVQPTRTISLHADHNHYVWTMSGRRCGHILLQSASVSHASFSAIENHEPGLWKSTLAPHGKAKPPAPGNGWATSTAKCGLPSHPGVNEIDRKKRTSFYLVLVVLPYRGVPGGYIGGFDA
jgi:hypothetical protein